MYKLFDDVEIMRKPEAAPSIDDVIVAMWRKKTLFMPFFFRIFVLYSISPPSSCDYNNIEGG